MKSIASVVLLSSLMACGGCNSRPPAGRTTPLEGVSALGILHAGTADRGFARVRAVRAFHFPRDQGPHPAYQHEWWYWTGHLQARNGERFGFELTFFRIALEPPATRTVTEDVAQADSRPGAGEGRRSRWRARQVYIAHFAVTDIARRRFHFAVRYARAALGLAGAQASPFKVWLDGWSVAGDGSSRVWKLHAADASYSLTLDLDPLSAPVLNGDRGLSRKSSRSASYYYSIPRLAAHGRLVRGGRTLEVQGTAWLDREWGSSGLGPNEVGWEWFGLQFRDGSDLMFYALRDRNGARDPHSAGTWVTSDGRSRTLSNDDVRIDVLNHWRSPRGAVYPSRWKLSVRSLRLDVDIAPVLADQELGTTPVYWEGDVKVRGTRAGRAVRGQGYVELVGYAPP